MIKKGESAMKNPVRLSHNGGTVFFVFLAIFWLAACESENPKSTGWCGDYGAGAGEVCDGMDLKGETCETLGFEGGDLSCASDCMGFDTSGCTGACGDGEVTGAEVCDGGDLGGETCETLGFEGGDLSCGSDCMEFDTSACTTSERVSDDRVNRFIWP